MAFVSAKPLKGLMTLSQWMVLKEYLYDSTTVEIQFFQTFSLSVNPLVFIVSAAKTIFTCIHCCIFLLSLSHSSIKIYIENSSRLDFYSCL